MTPAFPISLLTHYDSFKTTKEDNLSLTGSRSTAAGRSVVQKMLFLRGHLRWITARRCKRLLGNASVSVCLRRKGKNHGVRHVAVVCFARDVKLHSEPIFEYHTLTPAGLTGGCENQFSCNEFQERSVFTV